MASMKELLGAAVLVFLFVMFVASASPPPTIGKGTVPLETTTVPQFVRPILDDGVKADSTLTLTHVPSGDSFTIYERDGRLYQPTTQADPPSSTVWEQKSVRYSYAIDPGLDVGMYSGFYNHSEAHKFNVGIRLSPIRLAWDTVAPDLLVSSEAAGLGVTFFPPKSIVPPPFNRLGLGVGRMWDYDKGEPGTIVYTGLSIRF